MVTTPLPFDRARRLAAVVLIVIAVRLMLGVWPAALAGAVVALVVLVRALGALDRHTTRPRPAPAPVVPVGHRPTPLPQLDGQHLTFARGLAGLADWYLTECEREAQR